MIQRLVKTTPKPRATKKSKGDELPPWLLVVLLFWVGGRLVLLGGPPLAVVSATEGGLAVTVDEKMPGVGAGVGVVETMSLTRAEPSVVAVSTAWRTTTLIPSATAGCRSAMVILPSYSKKHGEINRLRPEAIHQSSVAGVCTHIWLGVK